jgi:hypothetical protein
MSPTNCSLDHILVPLTSQARFRVCLASVKLVLEPGSGEPLSLPGLCSVIAPVSQAPPLPRPNQRSRELSLMDRRPGRAVLKRRGGRAGSPHRPRRLPVHVSARRNGLVYTSAARWCAGLVRASRHAHQGRGTESFRRDQQARCARPSSLPLLVVRCPRPAGQRKYLPRQSTGHIVLSSMSRPLQCCLVWRDLSVAPQAAASALPRLMIPYCCMRRKRPAQAEVSSVPGSARKRTSGERAGWGVRWLQALLPPM